MGDLIPGVEVRLMRPIYLVIQRRRWPYRLYLLGWAFAAISCTGGILIGMASQRMTTVAKAGGIGLFVLGLILMAVLIVAGLDRRWPRRRYVQVLADERGLTITRLGPGGSSEQLLKWSEIELVEVERRPLVTEVRVIGAGESRGMSLKLSSLAWSDLDELVREILARSPARLVEGRRGRSGEEYS